MTERMLTDRAVSTADAIINQLNGLAFQEGVSVLISILAATLNGRARSNDDRVMLVEATATDLFETMRKGALGILTEGSPTILPEIEQHRSIQVRSCGLGHVHIVVLDHSKAEIVDTRMEPDEAEAMAESIVRAVNIAREAIGDTIGMPKGEA